MPGSGRRACSGWRASRARRRPRRASPGPCRRRSGSSSPRRAASIRSASSWASADRPRRLPPLPGLAEVPEQLARVDAVPEEVVGVERRVWRGVHSDLRAAAGRREVVRRARVVQVQRHLRQAAAPAPRRRAPRRPPSGRAPGGAAVAAGVRSAGRRPATARRGARRRPRCPRAPRPALWRRNANAQSATAIARVIRTSAPRSDRGATPCAPGTGRSRCRPPPRSRRR